MRKGSWRLTDRCVQEEVFTRSLSRMNMLIHVSHHAHMRARIYHSRRDSRDWCATEISSLCFYPSPSSAKWLLGPSFTPFKITSPSQLLKISLSLSLREFCNLIFYWYAFIHSKFISTFSLAKVFFISLFRIHFECRMRQRGWTRESTLCTDEQLGCRNSIYVYLFLV